MFVDWLKHAYISKFNNYRPALYNKFLDVLAKDYYTNAFAGGDHNITRRLGLPVIPLSCIFFRVIAIYPPPLPSAPPLSFATILPNVNILFRKVLENAIPSPAQSVQIFTVVLLLTAFIVLLILKLILGMGLLAFARSRYRKMKSVESEQRKTSRGSAHPQSQQDGSSDAITALRKDEYTVEGGRRSGLWGMVEVGDEKRKLIYGDDPEGLRRVKEKEDQDKNKDKELKIDHVQRYEMVAKKIW
ncbi:Membrane protein Ta.t1.c1/CMV receptor [Penicillium frequentans]|uniref:Membrane protein Ta.t1.c1/CMV receptor n=1 Tax=Penicillium frequentans TaxID=3151616 RepID=A0AAD6CL17_9EURO|nr:Membrane protein Ta.t1.c1/CMV receptor [Penicillium glabrum]